MRTSLSNNSTRRGGVRTVVSGLGVAALLTGSLAAAEPSAPDDVPFPSAVNRRRTPSRPPGLPQHRSPTCSGLH